MLNIKEAFEKHGNYLFGALLILIFLIAGVVWLVQSPDVSILKKTCGDDTEYGACSVDKPYFCKQGVLIEKSSLCGCPESENFNFTNYGDICVTQYDLGKKNITLNYFLEGRERKDIFTVYAGVDEHVSGIQRGINSGDTKNISRLDFKLKAINNSLQRETILPLAKRIQSLAHRSKVDQARIAVSIIQNIPYGYSNETIHFFGNEINRSRYPYEVLYDDEGICGEKSQLLTMVLKELGYKVAIFYFPEENHEAVGIGCPKKESFMDTGYCFVETSGPAIISDSGLIYSGGIILKSNPEIIQISDGISLPRGLDEYGDAKDLDDIRKRNFWGFLKQFEENDLIEKYGLVEEYNLN